MRRGAQLKVIYELSLRDAPIVSLHICDSAPADHGGHKLGAQQGLMQLMAAVFDLVPLHCCGAVHGITVHLPHVLRAQRGHAGRISVLDAHAQVRRAHCYQTLPACGAATRAVGGLLEELAENVQQLMGNLLA